ncbi:MAG: hypothetical protein ACRC4O_06475 [Giesbergeria sp.]
MVERRPLATAISHLVLILGVIVVAFPLYITFVASTHTAQEIVQAPMPLLPGPHLIENFTKPSRAPAAAQPPPRPWAA